MTADVDDRKRSHEKRRENLKGRKEQSNHSETGTERRTVRERSVDRRYLYNINNELTLRALAPEN